MSISIFLPVRKASVRVPHKNTRPFAGFKGGLLELKLQQLLGTKSIDEIVLSTNDENAMEIGEKFQKKEARLRIVARPEELASSETDLTALIAYAAKLIAGDHVLWTHVTSPLCDGEIYERICTFYFEKLREGFDSLVTVNRFQNFLWDEGIKDIINREGTTRWPQTQDLKKLYEINNAVFLAPKTTYLKEGNRVGNDPFLYEMNKISSLDVDEEEDFLIAESVYEKIRK